MKKKALMSINIMLAIIGAVELFIFIVGSINNPPEGNRLIKENTIERYYEIAQISATQNDLSHEILIIYNKDSKVIDTRVTIRGTSSDKLDSKYNEIEHDNSIYNVEKDLDYIKYNTSINNGELIEEILNKYNNSQLEEITVRKI